MPENILEPSKFTEHKLKDGRIVIRYESENWTCVAPSAALKSIGVEGQGLYALRDFKKGDKIGMYTGAIVPEEHVECWDDTYLAELEPSVKGVVVVDGSRDVQSEELQKKLLRDDCVLFDEDWAKAKTYVHKINDPQKTRAAQNVRVEKDGFAYALYDIPKWTELLWSYGDKYWDGRD
jgi:hypothetical protein